MSVPIPAPVEADAGRQFPEPLHDCLFLLTGYVTGTKKQDNWPTKRAEIWRFCPTCSNCPFSVPAIQTKTEKYRLELYGHSNLYG